MRAGKQQYHCVSRAYIWRAKVVAGVRTAIVSIVLNLSLYMYISLPFQGNDALFPIPPGIPITPEMVYNELLDAYGFGGISKWEAIPILVASFAVFRLATLLALKYVNFERR